MTECNRKPLRFSSLKGQQVVASFSGGRLTSDGGVLLLTGVDRRLGLRAVGFSFHAVPRRESHHAGFVDSDFCRSPHGTATTNSSTVRIILGRADVLHGALPLPAYQRGRIALMYLRRGVAHTPADRPLRWLTRRWRVIGGRGHAASRSSSAPSPPDLLSPAVWAIDALPVGTCYPPEVLKDSLGRLVRR